MTNHPKAVIDCVKCVYHGTLKHPRIINTVHNNIDRLPVEISGSCINSQTGCSASPSGLPHVRRFSSQPGKCVITVLRERQTLTW